MMPHEALEIYKCPAGIMLDSAMQLIIFHRTPDTAFISTLSALQDYLAFLNWISLLKVMPHSVLQGNAYRIVPLEIYKCSADKILVSVLELNYLHQTLDKPLFYILQAFQSCLAFYFWFSSSEDMAYFVLESVCQ